ncbi:unnamed protein product [Sphagnum balticum]
MGNSSSEAKICEQPLHVLVEDALATFKERPGVTEADIFKFLEKKYRTRISSSMKKSVGLRLKAALQRPSCRTRYQLKKTTRIAAAQGQQKFPAMKKRRFRKTPYPSAVGNKRLGKSTKHGRKIRPKKPVLKDGSSGEEGPRLHHPRSKSRLAKINHKTDSKSSKPTSMQYQFNAKRNELTNTASSKSGIEKSSGRWTGSSTRGKFESNHRRWDRHKFSTLTESSHSRGRWEEDEDSVPESACFGTQEDNDTILDSKDCYSIQGHCQNHAECRKCCQKYMRAFHRSSSDEDDTTDY